MRYFLSKIGFGKKIEDEELEEVSIDTFINTYYPEINYELEEFSIQLKLNKFFDNEILLNLGGDYGEIKKKLKNLQSPADSEKMMFFVPVDEVKEPLVLEFSLNETYTLSEAEYLITLYSKKHILQNIKRELL